MVQFIPLILDWIRHNAVAAWFLFSPVLLVMLRRRSPAEWIAMGERIPRVQGFIRMVRGAGFDPAKVLAGLLQFLTGKVPVDPRDARIAKLELDLDDMTAHRDRLMRAIAVHAALEPMESPDGEGEHPTVVPAEPSVLRASTIVAGSVPPPASSEAGHASLASLVMILMVVGGVALAGFFAMGCHPPSDCQAGRDDVRCSPAGVPQRCDTGGRWRSWATLPCQRVGRVCLAANGHATCVSPDGGVR